MAFYKNKIRCLDELLTETFEGNGPNELSFLGLINDHKHEENEYQPTRMHHDLILHDGSNKRLHVQYVTGFDDQCIYDSRIIDDSHCPFFPKATMVFLPRLQLTYVDGDDIFCTFKGDDLLSGKMMEEKPTLKGDKIEQTVEMRGTVRFIGPNRICLILELQPSSIYEFLTQNKVSNK